MVSGPSGVGKGTVCAELVSQNPHIFLSVSATSRAPRKGEIEGVHYFYKTRNQFESMIANDELLEYAEYIGNYYGTPKAACLAQMEQGNDVILEIELQGGFKVKEKHPDTVLIFVIPPTMEDLLKRLSNRGTESDEVIQKRMRRATEELAYIDRYDYIIVNDTVQNAAETLKAIITARHYMHGNIIDTVNKALKL